MAETPHVEVAEKDDEAPRGGGTHRRTRSSRHSDTHISVGQIARPLLKEKLIIVMVGLPARGKTYISRKISRYLCWIGYNTRVFNAGQYRRDLLGIGQDAKFFDPDNQQGVEMREKMSSMALDDLFNWLDEDGDCGIFDATNVTVARRNLVEKAARNRGQQVLFLESICSDVDTIENNIRETKLTNPDFTSKDPEDAVRDFRERIKNYMRSYEPMDENGADKERSFIQLYDVGRKVVCHRIQGYLPGKIVFFVMNLHITPRTIYFCRHGESEYNVKGLLGGDPPLSERGEVFAARLQKFSKLLGPKLNVWTSTMKRSVQTGAAAAEGLDSTAHSKWRELDEIDAGICDSMTYKQVEEKYPDEFKARARDKLRYRYPRGESYLDLIRRLEPVLIELERQRDPVLVVSHQAVMRCLYGYFVGTDLEEVPLLEVPMHTVLQLTPKAYGCEIHRYNLNVDVPKVEK